MISVIVCSIDPAKARAIEAHYGQLFAGEPYELISIRDAKSLAEAYNRGIDRSKGEILVFSHDDIEILTPRLAERLRAHLATFDVVGPIGASRVAPGCWHAAGPPFLFGQIAHPEPDGAGFNVFNLVAPAPGVPDIQVLDGVFLACKRSVALAHRFDAVTFDAFHGYDVDFTFGAYLAGFKLGVCTDIPILHASAGNFGETWQKYNERFRGKYAGRFTQATSPKYELAWVKVPTKDEVIRRLSPWYAPAVADAAPLQVADQPTTTAGIRVLFVGPKRDVPYVVDECTRLNGLFSKIATFKPNVIVTTDTIPASLNVAPFETRKKWIHVTKELPTSQLIPWIEACYVGRLWGHVNQHLHPLVSVFTATFNTGDFLRDTYQSLREQTYVNWEWIVVDDGSTDGTWERVLAIAAEDSRVRPLRTAHEGCIGSVKDVATRLATGVYLVELDHDDMLTDDALARIKDAFEKNPDVGMFYSNFAEFFQDGSPHRYGGDFWSTRYRETEYRGKKYLECRTPDVYGAFGGATSDQFAWYLTVGPNHVRAFRADELRRLGGYNRELPVADDWDLIARFFLESRIGHIDKLLYLYRLLDRGGNTTFVRNQSIQDHLRLARAHYAEAFAKANERRLDRARTLGLDPARKAPRSAVRNVLVTSSYDRGRLASERLADADLLFGLDQDIVFFVEPQLADRIAERREASGLLSRTRIITGEPHEAPGDHPHRASAAEGWAKFWMLRQAMRLDPFGGTHFSWIDFSIGARASTEPCEQDGVFAKPSDEVRLLVTLDESSPRGFRATTGYLGGSRHAIGRLCRLFANQTRKAGREGLERPPSDVEILTTLLTKHPALFELYFGTVRETFDNYRVPRKNAAALIEQMRRFRAIGDFARCCEIGEKVRESHRQGFFDASPIELSTLLDEYFIAAYYRDAPDQKLARSIALDYVALADKDPKFFAAFLLDHEHIRKNFAFLDEPVM